MTTKKVGITGRFGSRYGLKNRKQVKKIEDLERQLHVCPSCGLPKLKRTSNAKFECKKCNAIFSGGAYIPQTLVGKTIKRIISQKNASASQKMFELDDVESMESTEEVGVVGLEAEKEDEIEVVDSEIETELKKEVETEENEVETEEELVEVADEETESKKDKSA